MLSKDKVIEHSNDVVLVLRVIIIQEFENFELHPSLVLELLLVPYDLQCHQIPCLMI